MKTLRYILDGRRPVREPDLMKWARWFECANRSLGLDRIKNPFAKGAEDSDIIVSTVFLALDHSFAITGLPLLFETMIFHGDLDGEMARTSSWDQAVEAHSTAVRRVKETIAVRFIKEG